MAQQFKTFIIFAVLDFINFVTNSGLLFRSLDW